MDLTRSEFASRASCYQQADSSIKMKLKNVQNIGMFSLLIFRLFGKSTSTFRRFDKVETFGSQVCFIGEHSRLESKIINPESANQEVDLKEAFSGLIATSECFDFVESSEC